MTSLIIISAILMTHVQSNPEVTAARVCKKDIVQAYGMTGVLGSEPIVEKLEMCPKVVNSCCLKEDQMIMYTNFVHGGELQNIKDYYSKIMEEYEKLLETLVKVQELAATIKGNIQRKVSNCKLLSERILNYEAGQVMAQMKENLQKMEVFMTTAYSGFYCSLCNYDNHQYFDLTSQTIFFSEKFCRDIIQNSLQNLLLFQVDIAKHANLVNRFVTSCDFMGQYNLEAIPPSNLTFTISNDIMQDLQSCRDNRNKKEWFSYCKEICSNFQLTTYSSYFEPNFDLIKSFTIYVNSQLAITESAKSAKPLFNAGGSSGGRVLEDFGSSDIRNNRVLEEGKKSVAFKPGISAKLSLATFKSDFLTSGVSLADEGSSQLINEGTYNSVKTFIQIKKENDKKSRKLGLGKTSSQTIQVFGSLLILSFLGLFKRG